MYGKYTDKSVLAAIASAMASLPSFPEITLNYGALVGMTKDGAEHDIDLSSYGSGILGVLLYYNIKDTIPGTYAYFKPKDNTNTEIVYTQVANINHNGILFLRTDSSGIIEYCAEAGLTTAQYRILMVIKP